MFFSVELIYNIIQNFQTRNDQEWQPKTEKLYVYTCVYYCSTLLFSIKLKVYIYHRQMCEFCCFSCDPVKIDTLRYLLLQH